MKTKEISVTTRIENGMKYGFCVDVSYDSPCAAVLMRLNGEHDMPEELSTRRHWMKLHEPLWFIGFHNKWKALGLDHVLESKRRNFDDMMDGSLHGIYYYEEACVTAATISMVARFFQKALLPYLTPNARKACADAFRDSDNEKFLGIAEEFALMLHEDKKLLGEPIINMILGPIAELMKERGAKTFEQIILPKALNEFVLAMVTEKFNKAKSKEAFHEYVEHLNMAAILENPDYKIMDSNIVDEAIAKVINDNPEAVEKTKKDPRLVNWIVGQVMKACKGQAKAPEVKEKIEKILEQKWLIQSE